MFYYLTTLLAVVAHYCSALVVSIGPVMVLILVLNLHLQESEQNENVYFSTPLAVVGCIGPVTGVITVTAPLH